MKRRIRMWTGSKYIHLYIYTSQGNHIIGDVTDDFSLHLEFQNSGINHLVVDLTVGLSYSLSS